MMKFYSQQHRFYCGVDLHTRCMFLCVQDQAGNKLLHRNYPAEPRAFLQAIQPFRDSVVVACECTFSWYWLADLCLQEHVTRRVRATRRVPRTLRAPLLSVPATPRRATRRGGEPYDQARIARGGAERARPMHCPESDRSGIASYALR
jgi:hypothetical protein